MSLSLLAVDDDPGFLKTLSRFLTKEGYDVTCASTAEAALASVAERCPDIVLLDLRLPGMDGFEAMEKIRAIDATIPVLVMTAHGSISTAVDAIRRGATDFLTKPVDLEALSVKIEQTKKIIGMKAELDYHLQRERQEAGLQREGQDEPGFEGFIGSSPPMQAVYEKIQQVAATDNTTVLVTGPSGTGKELVARALHSLSARRNRPLMQIDCTSIPLTLLESELFGHERGSFTGADRRKTGLFELADGGTLFLDEIGDMDITLQGKFLRVLQERTFRRVGGTRDLTFDVRVVAATHQDLERRCDEGRFRRDLLYRLRVFEIELPPLRARGADILLLANAFAKEHAQRLHRDVRGFDRAAQTQLRAYMFPGNVRELRNLVEQAVILARGPWITNADLRLRADEPARSSDKPTSDVAPVTKPASTPTPAAADAAEASPEARTLSLDELGDQPLAEAERLLIAEALKKAGGSKKRAAALLGISRFALMRRLDKLTMQVLRAGSK